ncbi:MAG: recombination endonuclease VII [Streptosporangiales bacterium]|nr:recombination endonuclease VII [Streptosporangiales bacterium]
MGGLSGSPYKRCPDCGEVKPVTEFRRNAANPDGLSFYCRACYSRRDRAGYRARQAKKGKTVRERVPVPDGHKRCPGCGETKPFSEWYRNRRSRDGYNTYCKKCHGARDARDYLRRAHKLTLDDIQQLVAQQRGLCPICLSAPAVQVDHDHATGAVRAVLCFTCNVGLGLFKDRPDVLRRAANYLEGDVWRPVRIAPGVYRVPS